MSSTLRKDDKIIVVYGGDSAEREPSVRSGLAVYRALKRIGYINTELFDFHGYRLGELLDARPDLVFIALHGRFGEDGCLQGALELAGIRYTGSGPAASAICMDKPLTKMFLNAAGIPTPGYAVLDQEEYTDAESAFVMLAGQTGLPFLLKPADQGSGIGISLVQKKEDLPAAVELVFQYNTRLLAEEYLQGTEITQSIIGDGDGLLLLPEIELVSDAPFRNYQVKYTPGLSRQIIPARISEEERELVRNLCSRIFRLGRLRGCARIDMIIDKDQGPMVLEINTLPAMTETSALPAAAKAAGISMEELTEKIAICAMRQPPSAQASVRVSP